MRDPACQVSLEIGHAVPVPPVRSVNNAIVQNRFQTIETVARHIEVRVQYETHGTLRHGLAHDAGLARLNLEALLQRDRTDLNVKAGKCSNTSSRA